MNHNLKTILLLLVCVLASNIVLPAQVSTLNYNERSGIFKVNKLPSIEPTPAGKAPKWLYFIDFGDGHYYKSDEKDKPTTVITHRYKKSGTYKASLYLYPLYSFTKGQKSYSTIIVQGAAAANAKTYPTDKRKLVDIESSLPENQMMMGEEVRFAVHHKHFGRSRNGYLFFFFNAKNDKKKNTFNIEKNQIDGTTYYNNLSKSSYLIAKATANRTAEGLLNSLESKYYSKLVFHSKNLSPNEERRLLFSLRSIKSDYLMGEKQTTVTAVWIPDDRNFEEKTMVSKHTLHFADYRDPNKITVHPKKMYYRKGYAKDFTYKVRFKNTGEDLLSSAKVDLTFDEEIDIASIEPTKESYAKKDKFEIGLDCKFATPGSPCLDIPLPDSNVPNAYTFTVSNPGIGKGDKVFLYLKAKNDGVTRPKRTVARGAVTFPGQEPVKLGSARLKWRHKSTHFQLGYNALRNMTDYEPFAQDSFLSNVSFGLKYLDAPLGRGFSWGYELNYNTFKFERFISGEAAAFEDGSETFDSPYEQTDKVRMSVVDLAISYGIQPNNRIRAYASAGVALPILARVDVDAAYQQLELFESAQSRFGLLQEHTQPVLFTRPINTTRALPGAMFALGAEIGEVHSAVFGLRYEMRYFPQLHIENCTHLIDNAQIYLRFKLGAIGGKN